MKNIYLVSDEKRNLLINIVKKQQKYLDKDTIGIYIGIAFCPTKCTYCSFPAYLLKGKYAARYDEYIEDIYKETKEIGQLAQELNLKINTIYIGGGTPSILSAEEIKKLLDMIKENYDLSHLKEFTFEAGRIDTLNQKKLQLLKQGGVDKISINPQSFNEKTLKLVNRYHDRKQFDKVYKLAKEMGLSINMDLILGLPKETTQDILYTLDEVAKYDVENLTIHNLAIKNASKLNKENYEHRDTLDYKTIFEKISKITENKGLFPYYMYRQKNSFQWGENLGYSLKNCESIYNIEMIEENKTIIGIGAGAITKLIWTDENTKKDNIKRLVNPKDPLVWMNELEMRLKIKKENSKLINFHLNKKTFQECKSLGENLNYFDTEFFRVIFEWYSLKAKYEREQILFYEEMAIIKEAIDKKYELEFKVKDNNAKLLKITNSYPFGIFESKDENYNYFVTADNNGNIYSTRISNIMDLTLIRKVFSVNKEVQEEAKKRIKNRYYGMGNIVKCKIEFTEAGYRIYKVIFHLRPKPIEEDGKNRILIFNEPEDSLFFYFRQFGENIKILEPESLKQKLKTFYKKALESYEKN